jgi:hypothetical protein
MTHTSPRHVRERAGKVGLHLLLNIPDVALLNDDRVVDTLAAVRGCSYWLRARLTRSMTMSSTSQSF